MPPKKRARSAVDSRAERAAGRAATATDYAVAEPDYEPAPSKVSLSARQVEIDAALKITANVSEMTLLDSSENRSFQLLKALLQQSDEGN